MILVVKTYPLINSVPKNSEPSSLFLLRGYRLIQLLVSLMLLTACQPSSTLQEVTYSGLIMGTDYRVTIVMPENYHDDGLEKDILEQLESVNASMSTYLDTSEVSQINRLNAGVKFVLSSDVYEVIAESIQISELSHGAFDITVAKAVNLWGFGPDGEIDKRPSDEQLRILRLSTGYQSLKLENGSLTKQFSETEIDLSAIAKGYAVDKVAELFNEKGLENYLINVGGELRAKGKNSNQYVWRIAIEKPSDLGGIQQIIELDNMAIATSGDYRNYLIIDGKKYSHTIDPATLEPVFHRLALVSVINQDASRADALATALMAMGDELAIKFAEEQGIIAYFVIRTDQEMKFEVRHTQNFAPFLQ